MQGGGADASCLAAQAAETSSLGGCGQARGVDVYVTVHGLLARRLQPHLGHRLLGVRVRVRVWVRLRVGVGVRHLGVRLVVIKGVTESSHDYAPTYMLTCSRTLLLLLLPPLLPLACTMVRPRCHDSRGDN